MRKPSPFLAVTKEDCSLEWPTGTEKLFIIYDFNIDVSKFIPVLLWQLSSQYSRGSPDACRGSKHLSSSSDTFPVLFARALHALTLLFKLHFCPQESRRSANQADEHSEPPSSEHKLSSYLWIPPGTALRRHSCDGALVRPPCGFISCDTVCPICAVHFHHTC